MPFNTVFCALASSPLMAKKGLSRARFALSGRILHRLDYSAFCVYVDARRASGRAWIGLQN
jgi:hypothetical protein